MEFAEGLLTFDIGDFSKTSNALEKTRGTIEVASIFIDIGELKPEAKDALINLLKGGTNGKRQKAYK